MNMRQGRKNDNVLVRIGFLYTRKDPRAYPNPARLIKRVFSPKPGPRAPAQNHKPGRNPEISHQTDIEAQKSVTNPKSQIT